MKGRSASVALALLSLPLLAAPAHAAAPTLLTAGQQSRHLNATWSLPPGVSAAEVEVSTRPTPAPDGSFASFLDTEPVGGSQTSWRSEDAFGAGTYYVHVAGNDLGCMNCPPTEWSNVLQVVIPRPLPKAGRYSGRTEFPDSKPISFTLSPSLKSVRRLKVTYELDCSRGGFPTGELRGSATFVPLPVRADGSFSRVAHFGVIFRGGGPRGSVTLTVTGRLRPPERATGTLRARAALGGGERCASFPIRIANWSARRP
jgi:hypothetical protein